MDLVPATTKDAVNQQWQKCSWKNQLSPHFLEKPLGEILRICLIIGYGSLSRNLSIDPPDGAGAGHGLRGLLMS